MKKIIPKYHISLISLGNGTASRESEQFIVELLKEIPEKVQYVITNEAGASVYSASKLATEEFPNFDVGQRSAASIARRLQDPLAELVKITPQSIGVGQYQHDMNQKKLGEALSGVVEDCVNKVGVDLNTASASLLEYISGISKVIAKNIVAYREENGRFESRRELLKVAKLGPKAFEQCAGFARITGGKNPLDATSVHPESYEAAQKVLEKLGYKPEDITAGKLSGISRQIKNYKKLAEEHMDSYRQRAEEMVEGYKEEIKVQKKKRREQINSRKEEYLARVHARREERQRLLARLSERAELLMKEEFTSKVDELIGEDKREEYAKIKKNISREMTKMHDRTDRSYIRAARHLKGNPTAVSKRFSEALAELRKHMDEK